MKSGEFIRRCDELTRKNYSDASDNHEVVELARYTKAMFRLLCKQVARNAVLERDVRRLKKINQARFRELNKRDT